MAMHATVTRCLRKTPLSLFRQQIPKQQQQLSWSPTTTRAYSTDPSQGNNGSEKPAADSNSSVTTSTKPTTTTTTSSANPDDSLQEVLSEAEQRKEKIRQTLNSLKFPNYRSPVENVNSESKPSAPLPASASSESTLSEPPPTSTSGLSDIAVAMKNLRDGVQRIETRIPDKPLERNFTRYPTSTSSLSAIASNIPNMPAQKPRPMIKTVPMKLGPKLGRQIMVQNDRGLDCASAIRSLEVSCRSNDLRRQEANQKFHVRRGQARKNLRIRRWRKLFKFSFLETVKKIDRMRDQGW